MAKQWNSSHRPPAYFEWFYFHFATETGTAVNMVLHETDIFGLNQTPYLSLSLLEPGRPPTYLRRDLASLAIARQQPTLQVGQGLISETKECIHFDIPFADQGAFRGQIRKLAPPLALAAGLLYREPLTGRSSHWLVQVPHASFNALLHHKGVTQRLSGWAYQDHQWGSLLLPEFVSDWVWGHFSNDQVAVVFFQIMTKTGRCIERVGLVLDNGRFTGTKLKTNYLDTLRQTSAPETFAGRIDVSFFAEQAQLSFNIEPTNLMRCRLNESHDQVSASYLRWAAKGTYCAGRDEQPVYGITEYIRLRPIYGSLSQPEHH